MFGCAVVQCVPVTGQRCNALAIGVCANDDRFQTIPWASIMHHLKWEIPIGQVSLLNKGEGCENPIKYMLWIHSILSLTSDLSNTGLVQTMMKSVRFQGNGGAVIRIKKRRPRTSHQWIYHVRASSFGCICTPHQDTDESGFAISVGYSPYSGSITT